MRIILLKNISDGKNLEFFVVDESIWQNFRWNTSVGDYTISLASNNAFDHHSKEQKSSNIRFLLRPPDGVITALDSCGYPFWRHDFKNPIAKTWQLLYGKISEVFFFQLLFSILFLFLNIFRLFALYIVISCWLPAFYAVSFFHRYLYLIGKILKRVKSMAQSRRMNWWISKRLFILVICF